MWLFLCILKYLQAKIFICIVVIKPKMNDQNIVHLRLTLVFSAINDFLYYAFLFSFVLLAFFNCVVLIVVCFFIGMFMERGFL